jgi:hypothetical protein
LKSVNVLGPAVGYIDLLDHATTEKLKADQASGKDIAKSPLRPSSAGACTRELYYQLMQYSGRAKYAVEVNKPETQRLLNLGHAIESHLLRELGLLSDIFEIKYKQQVLSFARLEADRDKKLEQWLEGSIDLVLWSEKWKCVADVKSKKDGWSAAFKTKWDELDDKLQHMTSVHTITRPIKDRDKSKEQASAVYWVEDLDTFLTELNDPFFAANFLQLNLYANSDFLKQRGVNHGAIFQYCKNDSRLREIRFRPSASLYEKTIGKFQTVVDAVDASNPALAPRDYTLGSIKCAFCKFKKECWGEDSDAQKEYFKTFPRKNWPTDTNRMGETGSALEELFDEFHKHEQSEKRKETIEQGILKVMLAEGIEKLRLPTGEIYAVNRLKHTIKLKRTKL